MIKTVRRVFLARIEIWELFLIGVLGAVAFVGLRERPNPPASASEMSYFRATFGPAHGTEREEEWFIRDFFKGRRDGFFLDVGANHYKLYNKTYYLEAQQGWSGIAIEPQKEYADGYRVFRPHTKFFQLFVSDQSNETARLYVLKNAPMAASADKDFVSKFGTPDEVREVPTVSLNDLLDKEGIRHVDFVSMDIELHEPYALKGFDIERFKPGMVCVEALLPVRQQILDYFARHHYVIVGRYLWVDLEDLYFKPLEP